MLKGRVPYFYNKSTLVSGTEPDYRNTVSMKTILLTLVMILGCVTAARAQHVTSSATVSETEETETSVALPCRPYSPLGQPGIFNQLEVGGVIGTTGLGVEVAAPITKWAKVRAGFDWVPPVNIPMTFMIHAYQHGGITEGNFDKIKELMSEFGFDIDERVKVDAKPHMATFKFLVDVYPIPDNPHWRVTAGFYAGSRKVAKARNNIDEAPSLVFLGYYNKLYEFFTSSAYLDEPIYGDIYIDPEIGDQMKEKFERLGRLGVHMGDFKDGTPYIMEPGRDGQVKASAYVNAVRPYLGLGYMGAMSSDKRWQVSVDAGMQFWGGTPDIISHEGVNMSKDLVDIPGKVGRYIRNMKALKVYPTVAVKFSYTFF